MRLHLWKVQSGALGGATKSLYDEYDLCVYRANSIYSNLIL